MILGPLINYNYPFAANTIFSTSNNGIFVPNFLVYPNSVGFPYDAQYQTNVRIPTTPGEQWQQINY